MRLCRPILMIPPYMNYLLTRVIECNHLLTGGNGRDTYLLNVLDLLEYDDLPTVQDPSDVIIHIATSENNGDLTLFILIKKIIANFVACQQTISHVKHEKFGNLMTPENCYCVPLWLPHMPCGCQKQLSSCCRCIKAKI